MVTEEHGEANYDQHITQIGIVNLLPYITRTQSIKKWICKLLEVYIILLLYTSGSRPFQTRRPPLPFSRRNFLTSKIFDNLFWLFLSFQQEFLLLPSFSSCHLVLSCQFRPTCDIWFKTKYYAILFHPQNFFLPFSLGGIARGPASKAPRTTSAQCSADHRLGTAAIYYKFKFKFYFSATIWNRNSNNIQEANHMEWKQWEDLKGSKSR